MRRPTRRLAIPDRLVIDEVTLYVYRHHAELLTDAERGLERLRSADLKRIADRDATVHDDHSGAWTRAFPDMAALVAEVGLGEAMRQAARRVLEGGLAVNRCPKCGSLCRTPRALLCLACGHDWHEYVTHPPSSPRS